MIYWHRLDLIILLPEEGPRRKTSVLVQTQHSNVSLRNNIAMPTTTTTSSSFVAGLASISSKQLVELSPINDSRLVER